jgi:CHAT domain-containing protein
MGQFQLTIRRSDRPAEAEIEASFGVEKAFSIPDRIDGIEDAVARLQTDLLRDAATARSGGDLLDPAGDSEPAPVAQPALAGTVQKMGASLFCYLFDGQIEKLYRRAVEECDAKQESLEVTLVFADDDNANPLPGAPWLNLTPWEILWDLKDREFLATAGSTLFSRAVGAGVVKQPRERPLRVLIMAAAPKVYEGKKLEGLKGFVEVEKITTALGKDCMVTVVPGESFDDLQLALFDNSKDRHFDVFHFIGHGDFDTERKEGFLLFREPDGANGIPIYSGQLRELLSDPWAPLLVVLNSCRSAQGYGAEIFSSTAATLSLGRIPAVIAMQFPISDRAAIAFSRSLYLWLGQGAAVQDAVRRARRNLSTLGPEWITPVLYLRQPDYRLVPRQAKDGVQ